MMPKDKGENLPFKVIDRRRVRADGYSPQNTASGEPEEPFASKGYGAQAVRGMSSGYRLSTGWLLIGAVIAAGATGLGYLWSSKPSENQRLTREPTRTSSPAAQTEIYRGEQMPSAPEIPINVEAFNRYQSQHEEKHNELTRSRQVHMREVPIPYGVRYTGDGINWSKAFAFDINGDGVEEIYMPKGCSGGDCLGYVYQNSGSGYVEILDGPIDRISISDRIVNDYPVVFVTRKPADGFTDVEYEYLWKGQKYAESGKFIMPENLTAVAENIQMVFETENPAKRSEFLRQLEESLGAYDALRAFLQFQAPPGFTMPTGSEYVEYVQAYARKIEQTNPGMGERALSRYAGDPEGFFAALYGRSLDPVFLNISGPKSLAVVSLMMTARRLDKSDFERHMEIWDRAQRHSGFISAYKNATGYYPRTEEELWSAQNNVVREEQLRPTQSQDTSIYGRSESPYGTSESRSFELGEVPGDPRSLNSQPSVDENQQQQERKQQIDQETQDTIRREGGKVIDGARNFLENLGKPPPKKPPQN